MSDTQWLEPPKIVDPVQVTMEGGPLDGTGYVVSPNMAVGLPCRMEWFNPDPSTNRGAGWVGYERHPNPQEWPDTPSVVYRYTGWRSLSSGSKESG